MSHSAENGLPPLAVETHCIGCCACGSVTIHADPVPPEDWCDHHPEWADKRGYCRHPECHVAGPQVCVIPPADGGNDE